MLTINDHQLYVKSNIENFLLFHSFSQVDFVSACLFDLMLYVQGKQLRSCWDGQLLNHTVPGQASQRQFTSIKCPFFHQLLIEIIFP